MTLASVMASESPAVMALESGMVAEPLANVGAAGHKAPVLGGVAYRNARSRWRSWSGRSFH